MMQCILTAKELSTMKCALRLAAEEHRKYAATAVSEKRPNSAFYFIHKAEQAEALANKLDELE